jgi:hypothetical protein
MLTTSDKMDQAHEDLDGQSQLQEPSAVVAANVKF